MTKYERLERLDDVMAAYAENREVHTAPPGALDHPALDWFIDPPGMRTREAVEEAYARGWLFRVAKQKTP